MKREKSNFFLLADFASIGSHKGRYRHVNRSSLPRFRFVCQDLSCPVLSPFAIDIQTMDHRRNRVQYPQDPYGSQPIPGSYMPQEQFYQPQQHQHDQSMGMGQPSFQPGMTYMPTDYNVMFQSGNSNILMA